MTYKLKIKLGLFFNVVIALGLCGFPVFLISRFPVDRTLLCIVTLSAGMGLITAFLIINYLAMSADFEVRIDQDKDEFAILSQKQKKIYRLTDITSIEIQEQRSIGLYGFDFDFARYIFNDGKSCIVTNLMSDHYFIPAGLEPTIKKKIFPVIWVRTNV